MISRIASFNNAATILDRHRDNASGENRLEQFIHPAVPAGRTSLRTLSVPLDGSQFAEHAIPYALAIARRSRATVQLVHVHSPLDVLNDPWRQIYSDSYYEHIEREAQKYLNGVVRRISRVTSANVVALLERNNDVVDTISRYASRSDLLVLASHGRGACGRFWKGSVSDSLLRRLNRPMLFVRGYDSPVHFTADPIAQHVLIPLDGSESSEDILKSAATISRLTKPRLTVAKVREHSLVTILDHENDRQVMDYLSHKAETVRHCFTDITAQIVDGSYGLVNGRSGIARRILQHASEHDVDLIAMTTHPRHAVRRLYNRSVADSVLRLTTIPVLISVPEGDGSWS